MAYTALNLGYTPQAGYEYTGTTDNNADWPSVPNDTYFFDKTEKQVYYKDINGGVYGAYVGGQGSLNTYNVSSTQWNKTLAAPVALPTGQIANGFTFFDNVADKSLPVVGAVSLGAIVGTGYTTALAVPTTGGTGSGLLLDIVAVGGDVTAVSINDTGTGYTNGDIVTITQGGGASDNETVTLTVNNAGTTPYDEYNIAYGISITLDVANTSGVANINILGVDYPITFLTDNFTTVETFVTANTATLNALNVRLFALGSGTDGRIRFCAPEATLNAITITNVSGDITGTIANEFTGSPTASGDHLLIPYVSKPYFGKRILHTIRANFNLVTGSVQYAELGLFRYANDTQIGSAIIIQRNPDVTGALVVLETYTASATDSFVTGGFYLALNNNTGQTLEFTGATGILIQNIFDSETSF
jgi:hypothetical protein